MELKVFWRTLLRRWYLTLAVLALTIGATAYVVGRVGPTYEAEGSALVFPPVSSTQSEGTRKTIGNPYLELAGVGQARDVIIRTMKSRTVQSSWGAAFPGMSYEAIPDFTNSAPIILFTVEGDTADGATAGLDDLMARIPLILDELQDGLGLPPDAYVTARKLTQDARPAMVRKTQIRAGLLTAAVAGGLGLLLLALVDSLARRARSGPGRAGQPTKSASRGRRRRRLDAEEVDVEEVDVEEVDVEEVDEPEVRKGPGDPSAREGRGDVQQVEKPTSRPRCMVHGGRRGLRHGGEPGALGVGPNHLRRAASVDNLGPAGPSRPPGRGRRPPAGIHDPRRHGTCRCRAASAPVGVPTRRRCSPSTCCCCGSSPRRWSFRRWAAPGARPTCSVSRAPSGGRGSTYGAPT